MPASDDGHPPARVAAAFGVEHIRDTVADPLARLFLADRRYAFGANGIRRQPGSGRVNDGAHRSPRDAGRVTRGHDERTVFAVVVAQLVDTLACDADDLVVETHMRGDAVQPR